MYPYINKCLEVSNTIDSIQNANDVIPKGRILGLLPKPQSYNAKTWENWVHTEVAYHLQWVGEKHHPWWT